jgi:preprotein translocase subunit YajC
MISVAWAQGATSAPGGLDALLSPNSPIPFVIIFFIFAWFLIIRPQQKRAKAHQAMIGAIRKDDIVVTSAGFVAKVTKVIDDNEVELEIAPNVRVKAVRSTIVDVRAKPEPVSSK